jgi:predicted trehalose synthase
MTQVPRPDRLTLAESGSLSLLEDGRLVAAGAAGAPARAGDGLAAAVVRAVLGQESGILTADAGSARAVTVTGGAVGDLQESPIAVDQTHLSVVVSGRYVVKLVTAWGAADRAARQLATLARSASHEVPTFRGHLDWVHPRHGRSTVALVSDYVEGAVDGWTWAVDDLVGHLRGAAPVPGWPGELGALTARLHLALAAPPGSIPAPAGTGTRLREGALTTLTDALATVTGPTGRRLRNRVDALRAVIGSLPDDVSGPLFAGHGDLHVGQVLRSGGHYWVVDLDGDPQLPTTERERPEPAAVDVAHLLVSLDQVAGVAQRRTGAPTQQCRQWADLAQRELLTAYTAVLAGSSHADLLDPRLLPGLQAQQVLRELTYAVRFLPRWTYAGEGTLMARYAASPATQEEPWTPTASGPT